MRRSEGIILPILQVLVSGALNDLTSVELTSINLLAYSIVWKHKRIFVVGCSGFFMALGRIFGICGGCLGPFLEDLLGDVKWFFIQFWKLLGVSSLRIFSFVF